MVFAEDVEGTMDSEEDKPGSLTNGKHVQDPPNHYKKEAVKYLGQSLEKDSLLGMMEGTRARGR